ncbi:carbohydrate ABC transporter permease [Streptomyces pseudogriseolus]|uniref:Carbohydrate ABC transporter permease n=2 Tax=Streptomyces TaxID=1883 RepID=A0AB39LS17_9ACTN|nr:MULTISPECIES: carbohydrate ABC transporter permease [unclassified Streptomyces]MCI4140854.1 carbohydrate ABC transporter permease [Streptomyces sp. MMS20-AI2-20]MCM3298045.1 carbohydrate ABC transporter permease [Streptomyces pseudogriseolus]MDT6982810.1 carbohydrate ABC transporter permease [Streptomyces lusitanus]
MTMSLGRAVRNTIIALLAVVWLIPTWLLVVNALVPAESYSGSPHWLPQEFGLFDNMSQAWDKANLGPALGNSLLYAVVSALAAAVVAGFAAFATVIMPVKRRALWFWVIYAGTLLPLQVFIRPLFLSYARTSLYDTQIGLVLLYTAIAIPFAFFVMRNYALTLPREVVEAARMDGASWWRVFWQIHVPLTRSAMIAVFVFQFVAVWNDLMFGITMVTSRNIRPVMAALADLQGNYSNVGPPVVLGGALLVSLPTVVLFFCAQRFFVSSLKIHG